MKKYSKPIGNLLNYKQSFFKDNAHKLSEYKDRVEFYNKQPFRENCKMCGAHLGEMGKFTNGGLSCVFCPMCGHCNGIYEDSKEYCDYIYTQDGGAVYAENYISKDKDAYEARVRDIYLPKAEFLRSAVYAGSLADFGAGAGYFVSAARSLGFRNYTGIEDVIGYEVSPQMVQFGNEMMGEDVLIQMSSLDSIVSLLENCSQEIVSMIGVLEHLQHPREALKAIRSNSKINYFFFSVPLFSPSVVIESVFPKVMPRHLSGRHTHLFTKSSINSFCEEFDFKPIAEWWFGSDIMDLFRSILVTLQSNGDNSLSHYWENQMMPMLDELQGILDKHETCSEVHMVVEKI
jgi:hypothetical protein